MIPARAIRFRVVGIPGPAGSKRAIFNKTLRKTILVDSGGSKTKRWRKAVKWECFDAMDGAPVVRGPVCLYVEFILPRPKAHFVAGDRSRDLRQDAPAFHFQTPDEDKLVRSTQDAMKGHAWTDDCQVCGLAVLKRWAGPGEKPGAVIAFWPAT